MNPKPRSVRRLIVPSAMLYSFQSDMSVTPVARSRCGSEGGNHPGNGFLAQIPSDVRKSAPKAIAINLRRSLGNLAIKHNATAKNGRLNLGLMNFRGRDLEEVSVEHYEVG